MSRRCSPLILLLALAIIFSPSCSPEVVSDSTSYLTYSDEVITFQYPDWPDVTPEEAKDGWTVKVNGERLDELDVPAFQRKKLEDAPAPIKHEEPDEGKKGFFKRAFFKDNLDYPTFLRAKAD